MNFGQAIGAIFGLAHTMRRRRLVSIGFSYSILILLLLVLVMVYQMSVLVMVYNTILNNVHGQLLSKNSLKICILHNLHN